MYQKINGTILIISHQERILNIADQIVVVADGEIRQTGTREEILPELLNTTGAACKTLMDKLV